MKKIGFFKKEGTVWIGTIAVLQFEARARIEFNKDKMSSTDPDYILYKTGGEVGFEVEFGAAWDKYSQQQRVPYKAVLLDDPSLARPISAVLWEDPMDGLWYLFWDRGSSGEHIAEKLFVQEELKPQLGIRPLSRITLHMALFYPDLVMS
jgi:uncharacterized protein (DUF736 family)